MINILDRARLAVRTLKEPFNIAQVQQALGGAQVISYSAVRTAMDSLAAQHELEKHLVTKGSITTGFFVRTRFLALPAEQPNPHETSALAHLQSLALRWGSQRHASAD